MKALIGFITLAAAAVLPAAASSGYSPAKGELSATLHAMPAATSRGQVQQALQAWRNNPVSAEGWREVGGEVGWEFVGTSKPSAVTRQQVLDDLATWQRSPVTSDGWRQVHGDAGWVYVGVPTAGRTGAVVSAEAGESDTMTGSAAPAPSSFLPLPPGGLSRGNR